VVQKRKIPASYRPSIGFLPQKFNKTGKVGSKNRGVGGREVEQKTNVPKVNRAD